MGDDSQIVRCYHGNGQLRQEVRYQDTVAHGLWRGWYRTGELQFEETWQNGKLNGAQTFWFKNGQKDSEGVWVKRKQGPIMDSLGRARPESFRGPLGRWGSARDGNYFTQEW